MSKPQRDDSRGETRDEVTEASMESFPASDPPAFNASKPPKRRRKKAAAPDGRAKSTANAASREHAGGAGTEAPTTSQVRGQIPSGRTMGVSSALEPSAAPFDTDDEAAGRPASVAAMQTTLAEEARPNGARTSSTIAPAHPRSDATRSLLIAGAVIVALLLLAWLWLG